MINTPSPPLISIITITLNDSDGLIRTVDSLKSQTGTQDYEHIIVDGISDYDVAGLLETLGWSAQLHQGRDAGLYDAMNRGTEISRGDYLLYLNSGDTLATPETLTVISNALVQKRPDFLHGDSLERQLDGEICLKRSRPIKRLPFGMITHHQAMLFRRQVVEKIGLRYDLAYQIAADYDFALRHVHASEVTQYLPLPVCVFERGGLSFLKSTLGRKEQYRVRLEHFGSFRFAARVYLIQSTIWKLRQHFPAGYRYLKRLL